jgi:predicted lipoprotein with Yx(FWY)xxD motif
VLDTDTDGKSTCYATCAQNWPPLLAGADAKPVGDFTIITRDDDTKQWAYKGKPLYYFKNDAQPRDMKGDGLGGKWHVARP